MTNGSLKLMGAVTAAVLSGSSAFGQTAVVESTTGATSATTTTATTASTVSDGTISEFSPSAIVVRSTTSAEPMRYVYRKSTTYVDEAGSPVSVETVRSGLPVTVHYVREGDELVASRVIVHRAVQPATTVVQPAPTVVEKRSTTTTTTKKAKDDDDDDD
jgi:hypothetical protein